MSTSETDGELSPEELDALMNDVLGSSIPRPVRWADLTGEELAAETRKLADWVRWLGSRYNLDSRELPADWWLHGALIEELSALKGAWDVAYDPTQAASAAADWHMSFYNARQRIREWVSRLGGRPGERPAQQLQPWLADPDDEWATRFARHLNTLATGEIHP